MKYLVTCKRVTDPEMKIKVNDSGDGIILDDATYAINPFDEIAVEEAIRQKEAAGEGEIVLVTVGGAESIPQIRTALAMGADRAVLVKVDEADELDSNIIAKVLCAVYEDEEPDLFLMGKQSIDGDSSQVPSLVAEYLELPQALFASKIVVEDEEVTVIREVDGGLETLKMEMPAVISADLRLNEPRYPSFPNIIKAKRKEIKEVTLDDLDIDVEEERKITFKRLIAPPTRKAGIIVKSVEELFDKLKNEAKVL